MAHSLMALCQQQCSSSSPQGHTGARRAAPCASAARARPALCAAGTHTCEKTSNSWASVISRSRSPTYKLELAAGAAPAAPGAVGAGASAGGGAATAGAAMVVGGGVGVGGTARRVRRGQVGD